MTTISVRHDNGKVVLIIDHGKGISIPWEYGDHVAKAITAKTRKAEEYCKANQIIADNALLQRSGFPIGMSDNPIINKETAHMAFYDRALRKYVPYHTKIAQKGLGGIQRRGVVGAPSLTKSTPT